MKRRYDPSNTNRRPFFRPTIPGKYSLKDIVKLGTGQEALNEAQRPTLSGARAVRWSSPGAMSANEVPQPGVRSSFASSTAIFQL